METSDDPPPLTHPHDLSAGRDFDRAFFRDRRALRGCSFVPRFLKGNSMDAKLKADWVKALRSGEYEQCRSFLEDTTPDNTGFCCLGVLCKITDHGTIGGHIDSSYQWVQNQVSRKYYDRLVDMNDVDEAPFDVIADYIEAEADL